jgi:hypothetical protein
MSLELYIQNTIANRAEDALVSNKELTLKSRGDAALGNVEILQGRTPWFGRLVSWVKQGTALFSSSIAKQNEAERADNRTLKEAVATAIEGILGNKAEAAEVAPPTAAREVGEGGTGRDAACCWSNSGAM